MKNELVLVLLTILSFGLTQASNRLIDCIYTGNRSIELVCGTGNVPNSSVCWATVFKNKTVTNQVNSIATGNCTAEIFDDKILWYFSHLYELTVSFYGFLAFDFRYKANVRDLNFLNASHNGLVTVHSANFRPLKKLTILDLSFNNIQTIEIIPCTKLTKVNLSNNNISAVSDRSFWYLRELKVLDLSYNHIKTIVKRQFDRNPNLNALHLQYNEIKRFEYTGNFTYIRHFNIARNQLNRAQDVLKQLGTTLQWLDLSGNFVGMINATDFQRFNGLTHLNLTQSNVTSIAADAFLNQDQLTVLDLSDNQLQHLNFSTVKNRHFCALYLNGNNISQSEIETILMEFATVSYNEFTASSTPNFMEEELEYPNYESFDENERDTPNSTQNDTIFDDLETSTISSTETSAIEEEPESAPDAIIEKSTNKLVVSTTKKHQHFTSKTNFDNVEVSTPILTEKTERSRFGTTSNAPNGTELSTPTVTKEVDKETETESDKEVANILCENPSNKSQNVRNFQNDPISIDKYLSSIASKDASILSQDPECQARINYILMGAFTIIAIGVVIGIIFTTIACRLKHRFDEKDKPVRYTVETDSLNYYYNTANKSERDFY